jgi:hypothetical protein
MSHETNDPPRKRERPAEGSTIVRLAMEWRRLEREHCVWDNGQNAALNALRAAVDTRMPHA